MNDARNGMAGRVAVASVATIVAVLVFHLALRLDVAPAYPDLIVGGLAWGAGAKLQDLVAMPLAALAFVAAAWAIASCLGRAGERAGGDVAGRIAGQFLGWSLPAIAAIGKAMSGGGLDWRLLAVSVIGQTLVAAGVAVRLRGAEPIRPERYGLTALAIVLVGLVPYELALVLGRLVPALVEGVDVARFRIASDVMIGAGALVGAFEVVRRGATTPTSARTLLRAGQLGLPLLFLALVPARFALPDGTVATYSHGALLPAIVAALVAWGWIDVTLRWRRTAEDDWAGLVSPVAFAALLVGAKMGMTIPPAVSPDDYHFGERLLGWWTYLAGGLPYVDYVPPHGIVEDDLGGFVSWLVFDGTAASIEEAARLGTAGLALVAFAALYRFTGSVVLAFAAIYLLGGRVVWLFLVPVACHWFGPGRLVRPATWLRTWLWSAPLVLLAVPPQGVLVIAASLPLVAVTIVRRWRVGDAPEWRRTGVLAAAIVLALVATPLGAMAFNAVRYVAENGAINQFAYGIPWSRSWGGGARSGLLFEVVRMSWVAVLAWIALAVVTRERGAPVLGALGVLGLLVLLVPYSMGRIDPGDLSRPGLAAIFAWTVALPVALWPCLAPAARAAMALPIALFGGALGYAPLSATELSMATIATVGVGEWRDGAAGGLAHFGRGAIQADHWERVRALDAALAAHLAPRERYLDLTSRNAPYFYLDRRPPLPVTAAYNLVAPVEQRRAVEALAAAPPRIAVLEAANIVHDGGGLALRNPLLYRFVIDRYVPFEANGFVLGRLEPQGRAAAPSSAEIVLLERAFGATELRKIPLAWGRSERTLGSRMYRVLALEPARAAWSGAVADGTRWKPVGREPAVRFDLSGTGLAGADAGLLRFEFTCAEPADEPRLAVSWWSDGDGTVGSNALKLTAADGVLIVPLDASPRWLAAEGLAGLRIGLLDPAACGAIAIDDVALLQRADLPQPARGAKSVTRPAAAASAR